jgi:Ran GTPase-activating protein (RanGAP) involved in mRNA processing and transport
MIASLHEIQSVELKNANIDAEGASALADALKANTSLTKIDIAANRIGNEGVSALADALKLNTSVTNINLGWNEIGKEGALALVDGLKVNTSVAHIDIRSNALGESNRASIKSLLARNNRLRRLFLFDARQMLLSLMCADEYGVVEERRRRLQGMPKAPEATSS